MSRWCLRLVTALGCVLGLAAAADAQVGIVATPVHPTAGQTVTIDAAAYSAAPRCGPDDYAFCHIVVSYVSVTGSNGFFQEVWSWSATELATLSVPDTGPGQTLEPVTYAAHGVVVWWLCQPNLYIGGCDAEWQEFEVADAAAAVTPTATPTLLSLSPSSGSGATVTFTVQASSAAGYADISDITLLVHPWGSGTQACVVTYQPAYELLNLWPDSGPVWAPVARSSGTALANSQCRLLTSAITVTRSGPTLTLALPLVFTAAFSGAQQVYVVARTTTGLETGWVLAGSWTVPAHTLTVGTVTPGDGQGMSQTFTADFSSTFGTDDVQQGRLMVVLGGDPLTQACEVRVNFFQNWVYLLNDAGDGYHAQPIGGGLLANSRCQIQTGAMALPSNLNATTRRVSIPLQFTSAFVGTKGVYGLTEDAGWGNSGWQHRGQWTVPVHALTADALLPASGESRQQTFEVRYSSTFGASDVYHAVLWIGPGPDWTHGCVVLHAPGTGDIGLLSDGGESWSVGALNSSATLQNSQCTITLTGATAQSSGNQWTLHVPVTFASGFAGTHVMRVLAATEGWVTNSGWQGLGTWTVPSGPRITQVSPTWGPVGTKVTVTGERFGPPGSGSLSLNGMPIVIPSGDWQDTAITFRVPSGATTGAVVVTHGGTSNSVPFVVGDEGEEYVVTDAVGSVRMITGYGAYVHERHDYLPFGTEWPPRPDEAHIGFGGTENDDETGNNSWMALNYFGARSLHTSTGRFASVDPVTFSSSRLLDPQQANLYTYTKNNPLRFVDPDGREIELPASSADRDYIIKQIQSVLGPNAGGQLAPYAKGDRWFLGIDGDIGRFQRQNGAAHWFSNLVTSHSLLRIGVTDESSVIGGSALETSGGADVTVNPFTIAQADDILARYATRYFEGNGRGSSWRVGPTTAGIILWHEFGHAWAHMHGRHGKSTYREALDWENRARERLYGPFGPNNARRLEERLEK